MFRQERNNEYDNLLHEVEVQIGKRHTNSRIESNSTNYQYVENPILGHGQVHRQENS